MKRDNRARTQLCFVVLCITLIVPLSGCIITISRSTRRPGGVWGESSGRTDPTQRSERQTAVGPETEEALGTPEAVSAAAYAHAREKTPGGRVLAAAIAMVNEKVVVVGACWDFVNAVYDRAGFTAKKRETLFHQPETGPFADPGLLKPGDWVMYRNLPYGEIGHSAIFVEWIDFNKRSALTIEYVGGNRREPGQYREADLTKVWGVVRGKE
jgi:hypothetical protein